MTKTLTTRQVAKGEIIFSQGGPGHVAYFIRQGKVKITQLNETGDRTIAVRGVGELIGEMAIASQARRSATAIAQTPCLLMEFGRTEIERRMEEADPILKLLLLTAFERLREAAAGADYYFPTKP